jgi:hypothetical protein
MGPDSVKWQKIHKICDISIHEKQVYKLGRPSKRYET